MIEVTSIIHDSVEFYDESAENVVETTQQYMKINAHFSRATNYDKGFREMEITSMMPFTPCPYRLPEYLAIGMFPFLTVGLALTSISVYVYTRPAQLKTTIGYLLACLSIAEWLFLLTALNCFSLSRIPLITCSHDSKSFSKFKAYTDVYVRPFAHATKYTCVFITILISIQQWIAVFLPMKVKTLCNMKRTKRMIYVAVAVSLFLVTPKFFGITVNSSNGKPEAKGTWRNIKLFVIIGYLNDHIFNAFIVFFILFVIDSSIICLLKWSRNERMKLTTQNIKDRRTNLMLFAVLLSYVLTHLPSMIIEHLDDFLVSGLPVQVADVRKELSNFLMSCHPILSFVDYWTFSVNYRKAVRERFVRQRRDELKAVSGLNKTPLLS